MIRSVPKDRIFLVLVADAPTLQMDYLSWSRHWRCLTGQGDFDLAGFTDALLTTGVDGDLTLEFFNDRFGGRLGALGGAGRTSLADLAAR
jgi:4-hydroxyphenylpyruvate dioxygenase